MLMSNRNGWSFGSNRNGWGFGRGILAGGALGLLFMVGCMLNPATGERQLTLMSESQEIQMGREAHPQILASMGGYPDEDLQRYVQELGERLAASSERPELPWTFQVLDDPVVNAFALPGGFIYVTRGIMAYMASEAELAGVLGHEIGHVTARHSVNQISRAQLAQLGFGIGMILAPELQRFQGLASTGMQLLFLKFGRDDEHQADELGVRYMSREGYDPAQLSGVMGMLGEISGGEGGRIPEWLSTHPNPENREEAILAMAADEPVSAQTPRVGTDAYLSRLEGLVFGNDPREGYFRENEFYHPEMAFQLTFPRGWQTANLKTVVQGQSPGEDAFMALTLADATDPGAALQSFSTQDGIRALRTSRNPINGIPAASLDFVYQGEGQEGQGHVAFLQHGGTLLQILAFATPSAWREQSGTLESAVRSFRSVSDPEILNVSPERLRIVTLTRAMTLEEVLRREGAQDQGEAVRQLNRLKGNPSLESGRKLKVPHGGRLPLGG